MAAKVFVRNEYVQKLQKYLKEQPCRYKKYLARISEQYMENKIEWFLWCLRSYFFSKKHKTLTFWRRRKNYLIDVLSKTWATS